MSGFVVIAYPTILDGLVLRWFRTAEDAANHRCFQSVSRNAVEIYIDASEIPGQATVDAANAYQFLKARREDDAMAFVTHRFTRFMGDEIEPVEKVGQAS